MQTNHLTTYETTIAAPLAKVWEALTQPALVKQYFFGTDLVTTWQLGSPLEFRGEWENTGYVDKGTVLEFVPEQRLSYSYLSSWSGLPDTPENYLKITYEVWSTENGTGLRITQTNYDAEKAKHSEGNWAQVIDGMKVLLGV